MVLPDAAVVRARLDAIRLAIDSLDGLARSPREEAIAAEARRALQEIDLLFGQSPVRPDADERAA